MTLLDAVEPAFTPTVYALGAVVVALCAVIVTLARHVVGLNKEISIAKDQGRDAEVAAYKAVLPLTERITETIREVQPLLEDHLCESCKKREKEAR